MYRVEARFGPTERGQAAGRTLVGVAGTPLLDPLARRVRDLRISVTDRCNFRCTYCMPSEGMQWLPRQELLTYEELARIAAVCVDRWGFDGIRVTGGEPTVRAAMARPGSSPPSSSMSRV